MTNKNTSGSLDHLLNENRSFSPPHHLPSHAHIKNMAQYEDMYKRSIEDSDAFWMEQSTSLNWFIHPTLACKYIWDTSSKLIQHTWFEDGFLNVSYNCLDRHLNTHVKDKIAILWQGEKDQDTKAITYKELHEQVCCFANALKNRGIQKGDRVCIYLPMIPEAVISMLACARIGAIHSVVFAGYSAESLSHRINDSQCKLLITSNVSLRGGKMIPLKALADEAAVHCPSLQRIIIVKRTNDPFTLVEGRDFLFCDECRNQSVDCPAEMLNAEDPLFILYTSGSTGKPKGAVHTQAGYLLHVSTSHRYIFDIQDDDIYWCTADIGWVTGHSYGIYGPLANGATTLMFEGIPTYPDPGRFWQIIEKYRVSIFYTAPTIIRSLIAKGDAFPKDYDLTSLRILGTVGEPINPEAWIWYRKIIGQGRCPIMDTWWQTETGGILISPMPNSHTLKPGSASKPFFGVDPVILRDDGTQCTANEGGYLCIRKPWPGIMRTTWGDHERFINTYFSTFKDVYLTGDGCRKDEDGDYWLLGRIDDVVNISGHRIGTAEVESVLVSHQSVAEAAVVPIENEIKGQGLYAYIILVDGVLYSKELEADLNRHIRHEIGALAIPEKFRFVKGLPKTRSGKIMRRILRKIANNQTDNLGDISTLADPKIIEALVHQG